MNRSHQGRNRYSYQYIVLAVVAMMAGLFWFFWPSKVELTHDTYEIAIALYRVCNQQDVEGLQQIQDKLSQLSNATDTENPSIIYLQQMVKEARAGNWTTAMQRTREALADQTSGL